MTLKNALSFVLTSAISLSLISCSGEDEKTTFVPNVTDQTRKAGIELITENCSGCHIASENGTFSRISSIRKTPEGWDMNIARMMIFHGLEIEMSDRRKLVKYLSDTQGLAPSETANYRDVLERKHNVTEPIEDQDLMNMCARCHTYTRIALQRRDADEWRHLVQMHLGQWASIEYQMLSRERDWRADALGSVAEKLGQKFPFETEAWNEWQKTQWKDMSGEWRLTGHLPGLGDMDGTMTVTKGGGDDQYKTSYNLDFSDGQTMTGSGKSIVHAGYEWRGSAKLNSPKLKTVKYRQIWAASTDGNSMTGRFYKKSNAEEGIEITAWRKDSSKAGIMSVVPSSLKIGEETEIVISGVELKGDVKINGAEVTVKNKTSDRITLIVKASGAQTGVTSLKVGQHSSPLNFAIYDKIDYIKVTPEYGISRVGGGGGPLPKVKAQFEATGYLNGPDGTAGTPDDIALGRVPVTWTSKNFNEEAAKMQDKKFAGQLTAMGTFIPAVAGPNPLRKYSTNNAGDLKIIATYKSGGVNLTASAHLIATVQRWNNPPIP
jgi:quinohemoprotein amine dehydrogenase